MPSDAVLGPAVLGFDTSGGWCRAALMRGPLLLASCDEAMARGQGERLMPLLEQVLAGGGLAWHDLAALGVGVGPGNFTGIRISVAAARGLALGLGIPAVGVPRFAAMALDGPALPVLVPAPRGQGWLQRPGAAPVLCDIASLEGPVIADPADYPAATPPVWPLAEAIARIAGACHTTPQPRPVPLYLREADAAPPSDAPPALIEP
ncbi:MAG TPA: tRNA (adenosine(37)-N6)-threonylcarbamoyltransferase complex dimerization subunit type 1 TsaB [Paracoccus sp.]|nr:tRNA (adenosine(37)-N6)-threonylcarbamoyltransferase complex dimerization subunit type 1 TsaB [Paracoccus sp. (in: a-proteobacteria)]